jgi:hypothetical protein
MVKKMDDILDQIKSKKTQLLVKDFFDKNVKEFNQNIQQLEVDIRKRGISRDKICSRVAENIRNVLKKAEVLESEIIQKNILKKIKNMFREQIKDFINKSLLIDRGLTKPFGHPGDFQLIEMFYDNISESKGVGLGGDRYMLKEDSYVEVVRIRKNMMRNNLTAFIKNSSKDSINIMNLGCGSCREIREMLQDGKIAGKQINFTLIDWDQKALDFSLSALRDYENYNIKFIPQREDVSGFYRNPGKYKQIFGNQDLIYSIGLADYIPDLILGGIIKCCFDLLNDKGVLMIAHKNVKVHKSLASDWFCDWNFYPRNENDVKSIINEVLTEGKFAVKTFHEKTRHIFFIAVSKA